jgi:tetratricopeptide (TPR) repeat protein
MSEDAIIEFSDDAGAEESRDPDVLRSQARTFADEGRFDEALPVLQRLVELIPDGADDWSQLGVVLTQLDRHEDALAADQRATELDPGSAGRQGDMAFDLIQLGRPDEAIAAYDRAVALDPQNVIWWHSKATLLEQVDRLDEAVETFAQAVEQVPDDASLWSEFGALLSGMERPEGALTAYERATELQPDDASYWIRRLDALRLLGRDDDLDALLETLLNPADAVAPAGIDTRATDVLTAMGWSAYNRADFKQAITLFGKATRNGTEINFELSRIIALRAGRREDEAQELFDALLSRLDEEDRGAIPEQLLGHARVFRNDADQNGTLLAIELAHKADPGSEDASVALLQVLRADGELDRRTAVLAQASERHPDSAEIKLEASWIAAAGGEWERAIALLRELASADPDDSEIGLELARLLRDAGHNAEATDLFVKYLATEPEVAIDCFGLFLNRGDLAEAQRILERLTRERPYLLVGWTSLSSVCRIICDFDAAEEVLHQASTYFSDAELAFERGQIAFDRGDFQRAIELWEPLTKTRPFDPSIWYSLTVAHQSRLHYARAWQVLDRADEIFARRPQSLVQARGWLAFEEADYQQVTEIFQGATAALPIDSGSWQALAMVKRYQSDFGGAAAILEGAGRYFVNPPAEFTTEQGHIAYDQGDHKRAARLWEPLTEARPFEATTWQYLASAHRSRYDYARARDVLDRADRNFRNRPRILVQERGWLAMDQADDEQAARLFEGVRSDVGAWSGLNYALRCQRRFDDAQALLDEAMEIFPDTPFALLIDRGWLASEREDYDSAVEIFRDLTRRRPKEAAAWAGLAAALRQQRKFDEAVNVLDQAGTHFPEPGPSGLRLERGWLAMEQSDYGAAEEILGRLVADAPWDALARTALIGVRRQTRDFDRAQRLIDEAEPWFGELPPPLVLEQGWLAYDRADYQEAERIFARVREERPLDLDPVSALLATLRTGFKFAEAIEVLDAYERRVGTSSWLRLERGWIALTRREWAQAADVFGALTREAWPPIYAWTGLISVHCVKRRWDEAETALRTAEALFGPDEPQLLHEQGWLVLKQQDPVRAAEIFRAAARGAIAPYAAAGVVNSLRRCGRFEEAGRELTGFIAELGKHPALRLERAELCYHRGDYVQAEKVFRALVQDSPQEASAAEGLVNSLRHLDQMDLAIEDGTALLARQPHDTWLRLALALVHAQRGAADEARRIAADVVTRFDDPEILTRAARVLREAGDVDEAERLVRAVLTENADFVELKRELAATRIARRRLDDALVYLRECVEADPYDLSAQMWIAAILREQSRWEDLDVHLRVARRHLPESHQLLTERGWLRFKRHDHHGALDDFRTARRTAGSYVNAIEGESRALCALNRRIEAENIVRSALSATRARALTIELARIRHEQGLPEEALTLLEQVADHPRHRRDAGLEQARVLLTLGRFDDAERRLERLAQDDDPKSMVVYAIFLLERHARSRAAQAGGLARSALARSDYRDATAFGCLGILAQKEGDLRTAQAMFRNATEIDQYSRWVGPLVEVLTRLGHYEEAARQVDILLSWEPNSPDAHYRLGRLHVENGKFAEAERAYRTALALDPVHVGSICGLAAALLGQGREVDAERELRRAVRTLNAKEDDPVLLSLARICIIRGDKTRDSAYYQMAVDLIRQMFKEPDEYLRGLTKEEMESEAYYLRGTAYYKLAEQTIQPGAANRFRRLAAAAFKKLTSDEEARSRYPDAVHLHDSLRHTFGRVARSQLPSYVIAAVCFGLLCWLWYEGFVESRADSTLLATMTPVLLGIAAVALLYPVLGHLKVPGFEAEIQQTDLSHTYLPSPQVTAELAMKALGTDPQSMILEQYGMLGLNNPSLGMRPGTAQALEGEGTGLELNALGQTRRR